MGNEYHFKKFSQYLAGFSTLRFEWSLEYCENRSTPCGPVLLWVGSEHSRENKEAFQAVGKLLRELRCPEYIAFKHNGLSDACYYQGISFVRKNGVWVYDLYLHYYDATLHQESRVCYQWCDHYAKRIEYGFEKFSQPGSRLKLRSLIHPELSDLLEGLISNERLIKHSGYWTQLTEGLVREIYITYPWQPSVNDVLMAPAVGLNSALARGLRDYGDQYFRHVALSSLDSKHPSLRFYFSAPLSGSWPKNHDELRELVDRSGRRLHERMAG